MRIIPLRPLSLPSTTPNLAPSPVRPSGRFPRRGAHLFVAGFLFLCSLFGVGQPQAAAAGYVFRNYQTGDGLPNNTVRCTMADRMGFIWVGTNGGLVRYDGSEFMMYEGDSSSKLLRNKIQAICQDKNGNIWFSTPEGVGYFDPQTDCVTEVFPTHESECEVIVTDYDGFVWMVGAGFAARYDLDGKKLERFPLELARTNQAVCPVPYSGGGVYLMARDGTMKRFNGAKWTFDSMRIIPQDRLAKGEYPRNIIPAGKMDLYYVYTSAGYLLKVNTSSEEVQTLLTPSDDVPINHLFLHEDGNLWLATMRALYIYNEKDGIIDAIGDREDGELSNSNVMHISSDKEGNLWLSTFHGGVNMWANRKGTINQFMYSAKENSITGKIVRAFAEDKGGNIWVGTEDGGLCRFIISQEKIEDLKKKHNLPMTDFQAFDVVGDEMWAATYGDGVIILDQATGRMKGRLFLPNNNASTIKLYEGDVYVGTYNGLYRINPSTRAISEEKDLSGCFIHTLTTSPEGDLWVGSYGQGMWRRKSGSRNYQDIYPTLQDGSHISEYITSILVDRQGDVWVCTEGSGVCRMSSGNTTKAYSISVEEGLPTRIACAAVQDPLGKIWVSSAKGLALVDSETNSVSKLYLDHNTMISNSFCYNSAYLSNEGYIHMGTYNGMISFNPQTARDPLEIAPLYITDIYSGEGRDRVRLREDGHSALSSSSIRIKQKDATALTISYSAISFASTSGVLYECVLRDHRGREVRTRTFQNKAFYTSLRAGTYNFSVTNLRGTTPEATKELTITVIPPFFSSILARILYILLGGGLIFILVNLLKHRRESEMELERTNLEASKQKEIYDAKLTFFTNITHEVRTPLTLIKLPIDKIVGEHLYTEESKEDIMTIKANTERLLSITNQFLDIKKIQDQKVTVKYSKFGISEFTRKVCGYFNPVVRERHLSYQLDIPSEERFLYSDPDLLEKVLCNLLSNAVKYCNSSISVHLRSDDGKVSLRVISDGDPITGRDRERIFYPFYQIKTVNSQLMGSNGTGLGLPYSKNLAVALGGELYLDPDNLRENEFVFTFPVKGEDDPDVRSFLSHADETSPSSQEEDPGEEALSPFLGTVPVSAEEEEEARKRESEALENVRQRILIVEDSQEMRLYLQKELSREYSTKVASNGEEAMDILLNNKIDLVVSDIMMPVMDGCQLCNAIKSNLDLSHIPVILLTAAVGVDTRISTLEVGADGYIEKPFSITLLKATISNVFKNREITYRQFADSPLSHFKTTVVNNLDQEFMDKLHDTVMEHLQDEDLTIEMLSSLMSTSKSTLYRKVKANTSQNLNEYIRICRLKKAAELLSSGKYRINEVAYLTGFSSASYFTTSFQKQFNISPSAFLKSICEKK